MNLPCWATKFGNGVESVAAAVSVFYAYGRTLLSVQCRNRLCRGTRLSKLVPVYNSAPRARFLPRTVFAASGTAFPAALADLSLEIPDQ